jgi:Do/DeqQ family serine protease
MSRPFRIGLLALMIVAVGCAATAWAQPAPSPAPAPETDRRLPQSADEVRLSYAPIVKRVAPAVVNVYASRVVQQSISPFFSDPFFRHFFGDQDFGPPSQRVQRSLGSGVFVDPSGIIVTNNHVIANADQIKVALADRREFDCDVVLKDERTDLAVLRLKGATGPFPTLEFADSDKLEVGDLVLAIGDPFGVGQTVTNGIVSAMARTQVSASDYQFFIQTDAAINPGNSGGALIDMTGRLVGINTAIFSPSGGSNGIGFAIPSNMVHVVVTSALNGGRVRLPWVGASFQALTSDIAEGLGVSDLRGALVADVAKGSPGYAAGLKTGDLITAVDGVAVDDPSSLNYRLATKSIGATAQLGFRRGSKDYVATLALESAPEKPVRDPVTIKGNSPLAGLTVLNLSPAVAEELAYKGDPSGVIVSEVAGGSTAEEAGFQKGDVIVEVNGTRIDSTKRLAGAAAAAARVWQLTVERNGRLIRSELRNG